jgi:hypothetical protein
MTDKHHNEPPLKDRLEVDHAELLAKAKEAGELVPPVIRAIESDEEAAAYTDTAADIKALVALADAAHKAEKAPWLEGSRTVDGFFNAIRDPLKAAAGRVVAALNARQSALLAAQRKAAAEEAERQRREAIAFDEPIPEAPRVEVKEAARVVSFTGNKASASVKWRGEVVDLEKVPRQYLMVNQRAIDAAIAGGVREIPGVRIFEEVRTAIRR